MHKDNNGKNDNTTDTNTNRNNNPNPKPYRNPFTAANVRRIKQKQLHVVSTGVINFAAELRDHLRS